MVPKLVPLGLSDDPELLHAGMRRLMEGRLAWLRELEALGPPTDPLPGTSPTAIESPSRVRPTATERRWILASIVTVVALGSAVALVRRRRAAGSGLDGPVA